MEVLTIEDVAPPRAATPALEVSDDDDAASGGSRGPPVKTEAGAAAQPAQAAAPHAAKEPAQRARHTRAKDVEEPADDNWLMDDVTWQAMKRATEVYAAGAWREEDWRPLMRRLKGRWIWDNGQWDLDLSDLKRLGLRNKPAA